MTTFPSIAFHNFKQNKIYYQQFDITSENISSMKIINILNIDIPIGGYFHAGKRQPVHILYAELFLSLRLAYQISWLLHICEPN